MTTDFLPDYAPRIITHLASTDKSSPIQVPIGAMLKVIEASMMRNNVNIFAPPNDDYWHMFVWNFEMYSANIYLDTNGNSTVDIFPFVDGALLDSQPLVHGYPVARSVFLFPAGHA